ncbi:MAG: hypothetical protein Q7R88_01335 [bacterium]|nr:hypothetical protein [bacterium]
MPTFDIATIVKVFVPAVLSFTIGIGITPLLTHYLYKHTMWKKRAGKTGSEGESTVLFNKLHESREVGIPRLGGVVIWFSAATTIALIFLFAQVFPIPAIMKLDFLSRSQTWIPLAVLLLGAGIGLVDDFFEILGNGDHKAGGLSLRKRLMLVGLIGLLTGFWFYAKLDVSAISIPFNGLLPVGPYLIPLFALVAIAIYSGGIIDGIDGLAGGVFAIIFAAYGMIAFFQNQIDLAAFCAVILGGILAFLWFNIPPARFYMSETGSMALTLSLTVVAFLTDLPGGGEGLLLLPIIAFPLVITSLSAIIQLGSKRYRHKKVFLIAPLHHHFEALGWPPHKVTMRYWIIGVIFAIIGIIFALVG